MKDINSNGLDNIIAQAIEEMKHEQGEKFSLEKINLAELQRRTGISRAKLRRLKKNGFAVKAHGLQGRKASQTMLTGYTVVLDKLLVQGVTNAQVCLERLQAAGYPGGLTTVKDYIAGNTGSGIFPWGLLSHLPPVRLHIGQRVYALLRPLRTASKLGASGFCKRDLRTTLR